MSSLSSKLLDRYRDRANDRSPITSMTLSLSTTHLLLGTYSGEIHIYSLPSHQHLRTLSSHQSPITHISTLLRPPDLIGSTGGRKDGWPIMEIKALERMRAGRVAREVQECTLVLGQNGSSRLGNLRPQVQKTVVATSAAVETSGERLAELEAENKKLKANLERAVKINEKMWNGIVDAKLADPERI
jgi:pre-rRNA-processing protein IPI3